MKIGEKTFVSLSYTLKVDGQVVDQTTKENPLQFIYGAGFLLPKFEEQLAGLEPGDTFDFTLTAEDGYGVVNEDMIVEVPKNAFMINGAIEEGLLEIGNEIPMSTSDGHHLLGRVKEVTEDNVRMDFNHPMAGKTLDFSGEIVDVREATEADYQQFMGGGCNCGCGDECSSDGCSSDGCGHEEGCHCK